MIKTNKKLVLSVLAIIVLITYTIFFCITTDDRHVYANEANSTSVTVQNGLGLGINVITAIKHNDFKTGYSVLDVSALENLSTSRIDIIQNSSASHYSTTRIQNLLSSYDYSFGADLSADAFVANVEMDFSSNNSFDIENYLYKYFYVFEHNIEQYQLYINDYLQKSTYENAFSNGFLSALNELNAGSLTYENFFDRFGTHIVGSALYGGRLRATYSVVSNDIVLNEEIKSAIDVAITENGLTSSSPSNIIANINTYYQSSNKYTINNINTSFSTCTYGGSIVASNSIENFNTSYVDWCNSFDSANESVLIDYNSDGLVALWDILPDEYSSLATPMENEFKNLYSIAEDNLINTFKTGNYLDFSGGTGISSDPYLITLPAQMINIESVDMTAHYKLANNIDLSSYAQWNAIGGHYKTTPFTGVFDGDGHSISNLKRTSNIMESNSRVYFGLFGWIGVNGVVKNLNIDSVQVQMIGPAVNNANTRAFFGIVSGICYGTIQNVTTRGSFSFDCCTDGMTYLGSISGNVQNAEIKNCNNYASLSVGRYSCVAGGITGYANGTNFLNCNNYGSVATKCTGWGGYALTGGITGEIFADVNNSNYKVCNFIGCTNNGNLTATYYSWGIGHVLKTNPLYATENYNYLV